jgi:hypothetical protein
LNKIRVRSFWLQETASFKEGAPQRENYADERAFDRACLTYANEWRQKYSCAGCRESECPQCGNLAAALRAPQRAAPAPADEDRDQIIDLRDALLAKGDIGALSVLDQNLLRDCDIALGVVRCKSETREEARVRILRKLRSKRCPGMQST